MKLLNKSIASINDPHILCQHYLNHIYNEANKIIQNPTLKNNAAETYGEILYPSIQKLLAILPFDAQDVFVDLGSGLGKIVLQIFLNSDVKSAIGIEINPTFHKAAALARDRAQTDFPDLFKGIRSLDLIQGDFLKLFPTHTTVVLINSTCFNQYLLRAIGEILNDTPSIRSVFSLRPLPNLTLPFYKAVSVQCSWDTSQCYIYHKATS